MPVHPAHPDPEELAAWQAGDLPEPSGARVEAHVAGCVDCAGMVAAVERGRAALAGLAEVEPPTGLHQRLAAAIEQEATRSAPVAAPVSLEGRRRERRSPVGRRLVAALSAAAVVVLLVVGLVPLLRHVGGQTATSSAGGGVAAPRSPAAPAPLPFFSAPAGYSGRALRSALADNPAIRSAYQRAAGEAPAQQRSAEPTQTNSVAPLESQGSSDANKGPAVAAGSSQAPPGLQQGACVDSARNQAGDQGLRPAFFVETIYRGRPATVLVTVRPGAPDQADLWAFPRDDCSLQPFAHERVTVQSP